MNVIEVDPFKIEVSDLNERKEGLVTHKIEKSIEEQGVIQPPLVREREGHSDAEVPYEVFVGQRRVYAAQGVGLEKIPVVVVDWEDAQALEASITENIDSFNEDVAPKDRALAIQRLKKMERLNNHQLADRLGVNESRVRKWLDRVRDEWEGTLVHAEYDSDESENAIDGGLSQSVDKMDDTSIEHIRTATGGGEEGERMAVAAAENDIGQQKIKEASKRVRRGEDPVAAVEQVSAEKTGSISQRVQVKFTLSGDEADALTKAAETRGATENQVARGEIVRYLDAEGFL